MRPSRERKQTQAFNPETDGMNDTLKRKASASGETHSVKPAGKKTKAAAKMPKKIKSSNKNVTAATAMPTNESDWVVVVESAPSGYGCHRGPPLDDIQIILRTDRKVIKGFKTERDAIAAARRERDQSCYFDDWSEEVYAADQPPPYDSREGQNYDNDDEILIYVSRAAELQRQTKKEQEQVEKARKKHMKAHERKMAAEKAKLAKKGDVHYPWPHRDELCIPAELELVLSESGELTQNKQKDAPFVLTPQHAAQVKTLMIRPKPLEERFKSPEQGEAYQSALVTLLAKFKSLQELHWHHSKVSEGLLNRISAETSLPSTLQTLSIPLARLSPEEVLALAGFTQLHKLALHSSLDTECGDFGGYGGGYLSDSDEGEQEKPFCEPLLRATAGMKHLKVLDITGHMDYGCFNMILTYGTIQQIRQRGVKVELGTQEHW